MKIIYFTIRNKSSCRSSAYKNEINPENESFDLNQSYYNDTSNTEEEPTVFRGYDHEKLPRPYIRSPDHNGIDYSKKPKIKEPASEDEIKSKYMDDDDSEPRYLFKKLEYENKENQETETLAELEELTDFEDISTKPTKLKKVLKSINWIRNLAKEHFEKHIEHTKWLEENWMYKWFFWMLLINLFLALRGAHIVNYYYPNRFTESYINNFNNYKERFNNINTQITFGGSTYGYMNIGEIIRKWLEFVPNKKIRLWVYFTIITILGTTFVFMPVGSASYIIWLLKKIWDVVMKLSKWSKWL